LQLLSFHPGVTILFFSFQTTNNSVNSVKILFCPAAVLLFLAAIKAASLHTFASAPEKTWSLFG
jgi:hypothetical protein